jgi:hypothetical protein
MITDSGALFGRDPEVEFDKEIRLGIDRLQLFEDQVQKRPNQLLLASSRSAAFS